LKDLIANVTANYYLKHLKISDQMT